MKRLFKHFKRKQKKAKEDLSVINTDSFDKRRFKQIYDMSKSLQQMEQYEEIPLFKELLGDIWASLYKMNPKIKEEITNTELLPNKAIIEKVLNNELYQEYHEMTQLDDLLSAVGTVTFGKKTAEWLEEMKYNNQQLQNLLAQINQLSEQIDEQQNKNDFGYNGNNESEDGNQNGNSDDGLQKQMNDLMTQLAKELKNSMNNSQNSFKHVIANALQEAKEATSNLEKLFGDIGGKLAGDESGILKKLPLRNKLELAETLSNNRKMKEIAEWAGKFTNIAKTKQKLIKENTVGVGGIELGDSFEKLLPTEVMLYANEVTRNEFFRKHSERVLMQYKPRSKEKLGKGSIVLCLDQSGSMTNIETQSKGFVLAIMAIARKQKRNFAYIPFAERIGEVKTFPKGKIKPNELVQLAQEFLHGGTNFHKPLQKATEIIKKDRFKDADIIFITDGEDNVHPNFLKEFHEVKKEKEFNVLSLVLGEGNTRTVKEFSDKVIKAKQLNNEKTYEIFEI